MRRRPPGRARPRLLRHLPNLVQAMKYTPETRAEVHAWLEESGPVWWASGDPTTVMVATAQGPRPLRFGDWLIRGVGNRWYPVEGPVVDESYGSAEDEPPPAWAGEDD
jgi:hypothetical protein